MFSVDGGGGGVILASVGGKSVLSMILEGGSCGGGWDSDFSAVLSVDGGVFVSGGCKCSLDSSASDDDGGGGGFLAFGGGKGCWGSLVSGNARHEGDDWDRVSSLALGGRSGGGVDSLVVFSVDGVTLASGGDKGGLGDSCK